MYKLDYTSKELALEKARRSLLNFARYTKPDYEVNWHHRLLCKYLDEFVNGNIKRLMVFLPPRTGKQLADSTLMRTPNGWKTHGDLSVGDYVYHPSGRPVRVIALSEKTIADVEIEFTNGQIIKCHENHEWTIFDKELQTYRTVETNFFLSVTKLEELKNRYKLPLGIRIGIKSVRRLEGSEQELGNCIQVDSPDGLYLVGGMLIPTHNSELVSRRLPAYILGKNPNAQIIACSYSSDLASRMNRDVQRIIDSPEYEEVFPNTKLFSKNTRTVAQGTWLRNSEIFEVVGHKGVYRGSGVGSGITGMGANCFVGNTKILCYEGYRNIQDIEVGELVLSYSHERDICEWKPVVATRGEISNELIEFRTKSGKHFRCTKEHRIYANSSYNEAQFCRRGDRLTSIETLSKMHLLWIDFSKGTLQRFKELSKGTSRYLLWEGVFFRASLNKESKEMQYLWATCIEENKEILRRMQREFKFKDFKEERMSFLWDFFSTFISFNYMLLKGLCEFASFEKDEEFKKSEISLWEELYGSFSKGEGLYFREGLIEMFNMFFDGCFNCSSYRLHEREQQSIEFDNFMQKLSYNSSQVEEDTISSFERVSIGEVKVYDIQVEDNNNFFAEGILCHNCAIIDDPIKNQEEAYSKVYQEKIFDWYISTLYTRLEKDASILVTLTRWHEGDLAGRLLDLAKLSTDSDKWSILSFPHLKEDTTQQVAKFSTYGHTYLGLEEDKRQENEPLWPNKFSAETCKVIRGTLGSMVWNAMHQQRPSPEKGGIFKRDWWKTYSVVPHNLEYIIISLDASFKKTETSDFVAIHVWGKAGGKRYLLDRVHGRMGFLETLNACIRIYAKFPHANELLIEDKANGEAIIDTLRSKIPIVIPFTPRESKEARAMSIAPQVESGATHLPDYGDWVSDFVEQFAAFPSGKYDDDVDAMSQAFIRFGKSTNDWVDEYIKASVVEEDSSNTVKQLFDWM